MKRTNGLTAIAMVVVLILTASFVVVGSNPKHNKFKTTTRSDISALEAENLALNAMVSEMQNEIDQLIGDVAEIDAGFVALVAEDGPLAMIDNNVVAVWDWVEQFHPTIVLSDIESEVDCDGEQCSVHVSWSSDPPSAGEVEWGETEEYGNTTNKEEQLLERHRQFLGVFPEDGAEYHYRIRAEIPDEELEVITFVMETGTFDSISI